MKKLDPSQNGELLLNGYHESQKVATVKVPHQCTFPEGVPHKGDIWQCFGCMKRYIWRLHDDDNQGGTLQWRRYRKWKPRHKHQYKRPSYCRCGKWFGTIPDVG